MHIVTSAGRTDRPHFVQSVRYSASSSRVIALGFFIHSVATISYAAFNHKLWAYISTLIQPHPATMPIHVTTRQTIAAVYIIRTPQLAQN